MVKRSFFLNLTNVQEKFDPLRETPEKRLKSMMTPEDSGGTVVEGTTKAELSFSVIGPDGVAIGPNTFRTADLDIAEILEKKYDTDESIPSDSEPQTSLPKCSNDSGIEMGPSSYTPKLILPLVFPKYDSSYNNTGRFYSSETYDSDSSTSSDSSSSPVSKVDDIPLRSIHNCTNETNQEWATTTTTKARAEYEKIRNAKPQGSFSTSRKPYNMLRNRYNDVPCYDHSRVKIKDTYLTDENDYINASYADGFNKRRAYICTQGPQQNTISHFWQMIWENNSRIIVMTTRLMERGKVKCHKYWPKKAGEVQNWGEFSVKNVGKTITEEHFIRQELELSYQCQTRTVYHYKFTQWPDFGIPKSPSMLLDFQNHVNATHREIVSSMKSIYDPPIPADEDAFETSPVVIHCSAGIGRTGTYLTIAICREWLKKSQSINLGETVRRLRSQRAFAVQTAEQYQFCLQALKEDAGLLE